MAFIVKRRHLSDDQSHETALLDTRPVRITTPPVDLPVIPHHLFAGKDLGGGFSWVEPFEPTIWNPFWHLVGFRGESGVNFPVLADYEGFVLTSPAPGKAFGSADHSGADQTLDRGGAAQE